MSLETDLLIDRRRLKRRLSVWRVVSVVAVVAFIGLALGRFGINFPHRHIARLDISGIITDDSALATRVADLAKDKNVAALIVAIDSPGGSVAGGEGLHDAIMAVAARKPVVAVMGGVAASAGYMIAVPAARIFAREATLTGSIGVILETGEVSGLLNKLGVSAEAITSGPLKDQPSFTRPLTPQGRDVLHGLVLDLFDQFVGMVASGRHMTTDQVRALADGRAYTGRQALKLGLVDEIGGEPAAKAWLASARHLSAGLPVEAVAQSGGGNRLFGVSFGGSLGKLLQGAANTVFSQRLTLDGAMAVWQPGMTGP